MCFAAPDASARRFFAEFSGVRARSRRRIRQSRRKNTGFAACTITSGHTSPVPTTGRKFETK
jgi:hypothetical protein